MLTLADWTQAWRHLRCMAQPFWPAPCSRGPIHVRSRAGAAEQSQDSSGRTAMDRRTFNKLMGAGWSPPRQRRGRCAARWRRRAAQGRLHLSRSGRRFRLDLSARRRAQGGARRISATRSRPPMSRTCPRAPDCEHVLNDLAAKGNKLIFATSFGYMNYTIKVAAALSQGDVRALHRLQARQERRDLQHPLLRGPLSSRA